MRTAESLSSFVQHVWVARDHEERDDKAYVVAGVRALENALREARDTLLEVSEYLR